jgi:hypothetical protein
VRHGLAFVVGRRREVHGQNAGANGEDAEKA